MGMYLFELVKQMAFNAAFVILIVLCCRGILSRLPRVYSYVLWLVVALRLLCPVMLPSDMSIFGLLGQADRVAVQQGSLLISDGAVIQQDSLLVSDGAKTVGTSLPEEKNTGISMAGILQSVALVDKETKNQLLFYGWTAGMAAFAAYGFAANLILREKLKFATKLEGKSTAYGNEGSKRARIYESGAIKSPFVYGIVMPKIYLPYHLTKQEQAYILAHEQYHIKRKDYLVKALAYLLLCVYWFHPLVWLSYYLMNRDMEISCDEAVMRGKSDADRENYAALLLSFAAGKRGHFFAPISFGENSIKQRVHYILQEKRRVFAGSFLAVAVIAFAAVICLTDANTSADTSMDMSEGKTVSTEAQHLYEKRNPYVGDASANGALLTVIDEVCGMEFSEKFFLTTELQTDQEPYAFIMHLTPAEGQKYLNLTEEEETNIWTRAVLFLALTENCGEVQWDYETEEGLLTYYIRAEDVPVENGVSDVKEYGTSPEMLDKLLARLTVETPEGEKLENGGQGTVAGEPEKEEETKPEDEWIKITLSDGTTGYTKPEYLSEENPEDGWIEVQLEDGTTGYVKEYISEENQGDEWIEVQLEDGTTGYVKREYLGKKALEIPLKDGTLEESEKEEIYEAYLRELENIKNQQEEMEQKQKNLEAQNEAAQ